MNRFGSRTEDFTLTRTLPLDSGGKVDAIGRGGATVVVFASGARAGTTDGRRSAAGAIDWGAEGGLLVMGAGGALAAGVLGGAGATLTGAGGALSTAGMVPEVLVEAGGGIGGGPLLSGAGGIGGGGGPLLTRGDGGDG
jgi:hypothetical protein